MANSKVGNYRLEYIATGFTNPARSHIFGCWVIPETVPSPGDLPEDIFIRLKDGTADPLDQVAQLHWDFVRLLYDGVVNVSSWELWRYDTEHARTFITSGVLINQTGSGGGIQVARYIILSFRTAVGGTIKLEYLEPNQGGNNYNALVPNALGTSPQRIAAYVLSASSPVTGLDNTFAVSGLRDSRGENELIWREVNR